MFRKGGTFISREQYRNESGMTEAQLRFAIKSIVDPATNASGQLLKKDKKNVADLFNKFIEAKKNLPERYEIKINLTSMKSMEALIPFDIFVHYRNKEFKFTFNDFVYFSAMLLELYPKAFYAAIIVSINEKSGIAKIKL